MYESFTFGHLLFLYVRDTLFFRKSMMITYTDNSWVSEKLLGKFNHWSNLWIIKFLMLNFAHLLSFSFSVSLSLSLIIIIPTFNITFNNRISCFYNFMTYLRVYVYSTVPAVILIWYVMKYVNVTFIYFAELTEAKTILVKYLMLITINYISLILWSRTYSLEEKRPERTL